MSSYIVRRLMMALVVLGLGWISIIALYINYFCMSIMFPTIFALGIKELGGNTKRASSILVMTIVGGAICPVFMGWIADVSTMAVGFLVPLFCFIYIFWFGLNQLIRMLPENLPAIKKMNPSERRYAAFSPLNCGMVSVI